MGVTKTGWFMVAGGLLLGLVGCSSEARLAVVVFTDVAPESASTVLVEVASSPFQTFQEIQRTTLHGSEDLLGGIAAGAWPALPCGPYFVTVSLEDSAGAPVLSRTAFLSLESDLSFPISLSDRCRITDCPVGSGPSDQTECVGGMCVNESCSEQFLAACPTECVADDDCPLADPCGRSLCVDGACLSRADACLPEERCDSIAGCVPSDA